MKESKDGIKLDMNIGDEHTIVSTAFGRWFVYSELYRYYRA